MDGEGEKRSNKAARRAKAGKINHLKEVRSRGGAARHMNDIIQLYHFGTSH